MKRILSMLLGLCALALPATAQTLKGTYSGLFSEAGGINQQSSGSFTVTTSTKPSFSGKLLLGASSVSLKGTFNTNGHASLAVPRKGLATINVELQLSPDTNRITGTVSDGNWTADLSGDRAIFDGKTSFSPQAGRYTLIIPGNPASSATPGGDSYGTILVDGAGRVSLAGMLADGTKLTQAAAVSAAGQWPFYVQLYSGGGSLFSWLTFTNGPDGAIVGLMNWIRPANVPKSKYYLAGFTNNTAVAASIFLPPPKGTVILYLLSGNIFFEGGNLAQPITNRFLIDGNNVVRNLGSNTFSMTFTPSTGAFKGSVTDPAASKALAFSGVVLQQPNVGAGSFPGTNQYGRVRFGLADSDSIAFLTKGSSFSPEVSYTNTPDLFRWVWSDNTTSSNYPVASKNFGKSGLRNQYLTLYPSGTLTSINLGFDASDGGQNTPLNLRTQQNVAAVTFPFPLTGLQYWSSSYNSMSNLDFTGFTALQDIECFHCTNLTEITVAGLPSLRRLCVESCGLPALDLTGVPTLEDVRAAVNAYHSVTVAGGTGPNIWHWCTRDNPQIEQHFQTFMTNFFSLREYWIWSANQSGALTFVSTNLTDVECYNNFYGSADVSGQTNLLVCLVHNNVLTNLDITGCGNLQILDASNNQLPSAQLDNILLELDALSPPHLQRVDLRGNSFPSIAGYTSYTNLVNGGATVFVDFP